MDSEESVEVVDSLPEQLLSLCLLVPSPPFDPPVELVLGGGGGGAVLLLATAKLSLFLMGDSVDTTAAVAQVWSLTQFYSVSFL